MHSAVKKGILTAAAALIVVAAVSLIFKSEAHTLHLTDAETGKVYARYSFGEADTFSVTFIHSVNQSPVTDFYKRGENNSLILYETVFYSFGAGMPESWPPDAIVETSAAGIRVTNLHLTMPDVTYIVGTVSDHVLKVGEEEISLRALCGKNSEVLFKLT